MSRIVWGEGDRSVDVGVDRGVLYLPTGVVPWNGLVTVEEQFADRGDSTIYFDGHSIVVVQTAEDFEATIEAYTYPREFERYEGKVPVDMSYRAGDHIHLVYGAFARPIPPSYRTIGQSIDTTLFKWQVMTLPQRLVQGRPSAHLVLDISEATDDALTQVEALLYGDDDTDPFLPNAADLIELVLEHSVLRIFDHGDGTWTAIGPDHMIQEFEDDSFEIASPSATWIDGDTYTLSDYMEV